MLNRRLQYRIPKVLIRSDPANKNYEKFLFWNLWGYFRQFLGSRNART
jgi:hypothetical protein